MAATEQTLYPIQRLHKIFAAASLVLLATTIWMLVADHRRPWKRYQRAANQIDARVATWRQFEVAADEPARRRLEAVAAERRSEWLNWQGGFPWFGKRILELPIVDAFNSPLRVHNLWADGLTQDYNFREVPRFDRCTTCHAGIDKTLPGIAATAGFPREQTFEFTLPLPAATEAASPTKPADDEGLLDESLGLRLAAEGLLAPDDVTVAFVRADSPAAKAALVVPVPPEQTADEVMRDLLGPGRDVPADQVQPGLLLGDALLAIDGQTVTGHAEARRRLADAIRKPAAESLALTIRRGLPQPYAGHPRLDLFVGDSSPHRLADFACSVCHEGQGSATDFKWASHTPSTEADRKRWRSQHGWFDNPHWPFPMHAQRFAESACLKCHHRVTDLLPSERFPEPPAPKLLRGYELVRRHGCFACHPIEGFEGSRRIGPDLRVEPDSATARRDATSTVRDVSPPGDLRKPGPSLRHIAGQVDAAFLYDWLRDPRRFRPTTRMPRFFGLRNHLSASSRAVAEVYEPIEIRGLAAFLQHRALAAPPSGVSPPLAPNTSNLAPARGRVLFQTRGCLACHAHKDFPDAATARAPDDITQGPDLSAIADKFTGERGRQWLYGFIRQPSRYVPRTLMPDLLLTPIEQTDAAGQTFAVTDPAADIVEYLLKNSSTGYTPPALPELDQTALDRRTLDYLEDTFPEAQAREHLVRGIPARQCGHVQAAEQELVVRDEQFDNPQFRLPDEQKLRYVGSRAIAKFGCASCHDIAGFETAKPIGVALADWGRKDPTQLAFESIVPYLLQGLADAGDRPDDFFLRQIQSGNRIGFAFQKLTEPRSFDYRVVETKRYNERLRMPQFPFSAADREAIITFLLGLVAHPPQEKYVHHPDRRGAAIADGQRVLAKYACASCHLLTPPTWEIEHAPGQLAPQATTPTFPFVPSHVPPQELKRSATADRRGLLHASLIELPALQGDGRPIVFDDAGDELFEDEKYDPRTLEFAVQLWQPVALEGRAFQVGESPVNVPGGAIVGRRRAEGGYLARYLLPHVVTLERAENPNARGDQAWGWLPPPLIGEGRKVQPAWLHNYLLDPQPIRPASFMRMPKFDLSAQEARALADYFAARDGAEFPYEFIDRRSRTYLAAREQAYRDASAPADRSRFDAALRIVTDKNNCVTCHIIGDFTPQTSDRAKGPDLAQVHQRLRPDYVRNWIAKPVSQLPYTGMPVIIPYQPDAEHQGGVAQSLYHGTSVEQLDAVVDLLLNFDAFASGRSGVAGAAAESSAAAKAPTEPPAP